MGKALFRFNGGKGALLCSNCSVIIKTGKDFTENELAALRGEIQIQSAYCDECQKSVIDLMDITPESDNKVDAEFIKNIIPHMEVDETFKEEVLKHISENLIKGLNGNVGR